MTKIDKVLFTGKTHTTASNGGAASAHGKLDINLTTPGNRTAPQYAYEAVQSHPTAEQLFAGAWSACYIAALGLAAKELNVEVPANLSVEIEVDLGMTGAEYFLQGRITANLPGVAQEAAQAVAQRADDICPYSKATRGNIAVALNVVTA